jgi:hypothetical protein
VQDHAQAPFRIQAERTGQEENQTLGNGAFTRNTSLVSDDTKSVGQQQLKHFNFCRPTKKNCVVRQNFNVSCKKPLEDVVLKHLRALFKEGLDRNFVRKELAWPPMMIARIDFFREARKHFLKLSLYPI